MYFFCISQVGSGQEVTGKARMFFEEEVEFYEELLNVYSQALHKLVMMLAVAP